MTTIPGTHYTKKLLEAELEIDDVKADWSISPVNQWISIGVKYNQREQYDKALAWFLLSASSNVVIPGAFNNIGELYHKGLGVPVNFLCALKWYLKATFDNYCFSCFKNIGELFENGQGVPVDNYKALEWYCHDYGSEVDKNKLKARGYHRSEEDKKKKRKQLRIETEAILEAEKKKLEEKKHKTQEETETLKQLNTTYEVFKAVRSGKNKSKDIPVIISDDKQIDVQSVNGSTVSYTDDRLGLKNQNLLLEKEKIAFESQTKAFPLLTQEKSQLKLQIKGKDSKISSLECEIQGLESKVSSLQNENKTVMQEKAALEQQMKKMGDGFSSLENEKCPKDSSSIQQKQRLNILRQEKQVMKHDEKQNPNEKEQSRVSLANLEQLLKSKEEIIVSLNRENQILSKLNQGNQQGTNEVLETLRSLLQAKGNEIELLKQNMEHLLVNEKRKIDALEHENRVLKQEKSQQQTAAQHANTLNNSIHPNNIGSSFHDQFDDSQNDINYDTEIDNTEESDGGDINYDSPSEEEGD